MANVRAEVLAASRSRTGWRSGGATASVPAAGRTGNAVTNKLATSAATQPQQQTTYLATVKCNYETGRNYGKPDGRKSNVAKSEAPVKPPRATGSKVSSIANMFQNMTPNKVGENIFVTKPGVVTKAETLVNERTVAAKQNRSNERTTKSTPDDNRETNQVQVHTPNTHLNRTESHLARFNNARAMFERLEEESMRNKIVFSPGMVKKRSGSVSPMRSSDTIRSSLSSPPLSPGAEDEKNGLSPKEKSQSADSILERNDNVGGTAAGFNNYQRQQRTPQQSMMVERARNGGLHLDLKSHADGLGPKSGEGGTKIPVSARTKAQDAASWQQRKKDEKNAQNSAAAAAATATSHITPSPSSGQTSVISKVKKNEDDVEGEIGSKVTQGQQVGSYSRTIVVVSQYFISG